MRALLLAAVLSALGNVSLYPADPAATPPSLKLDATASPIVLGDKDNIATTAHFRPPVEITVVAMTDDTNLRIGYAADQIIFNWEMNRQQLRVDGGPANRKHKAGAGEIPKGKYVTVKWVVTPKRQTITVDDQLRFEHKGDYSGINKPVRVFTHQSKVSLKSLEVKPLPAGAE